MLVICEDCAKKHHIDETRIKGVKAKFTCNECGHIIVVEKPQRAPEPKREVSSNEELMAKHSTDEPLDNDQRAGTPSLTDTAKEPPSVHKGKGNPIRTYIFVAMIMGLSVISGAFAYIYLKYIPEIIYNQIELRTSAISESLSGVITKPLLLRNYLQVSQDAQRTSKLPGVAYAAVVNKKGIVIAGFFSDLTRFDKKFEMEVKERGFPTSLLAQNKAGRGNGNATLTVGGQTIFDKVTAVPDSGGEVHIGIYVSEVDDAIQDALFSPISLSVVGSILFFGFVIIFLLTRKITKPLQELTDIANRISLGELDLVIVPTGPREMRELATAFERMRFSIKAAVDRLRK